MAKKGKKVQKKQQKKPQQTNFLAGIQEEMKQVTWPSRPEAVQLTITVIIISLIVALYVGIIDFSLAKVLEAISQ